MCRVDEAGLTDEQIRHARHGYYAAVSYMDERIGEVLGALQASGLAQRTTVLFTADHGEFLGERGLWYKMSFLEPSLRVPLLVSRPGARHAGSRSRFHCSTSRRRCSSSPASGRRAAGPQRRPLARRHRDRRGPPPSHPVLAEYHAEGVRAPSAMIRDGDHKLIVSGEDPDLLYDLSADPRERTTWPVTRRSLHARRAGGAAARPPGPRRDRRRGPGFQRERHLVSRALGRGRRTSWDFQPQADAAIQYVRNREDLYELQRQARLDEPGPAEPFVASFRLPWPSDHSRPRS